MDWSTEEFDFFKIKSVYIKYEITYMIHGSVRVVNIYLRGAVGRTNGDLKWNRATSSGTATATARHSTGTGTGPAANIPVRPARAKAGNPAGAVAGGTPRELTRPHHRFLLHH